jgi:hypothetical protein
LSASDEIRRADFAYLTGRPASAVEIAGSGTIRMHYENDGSIRQMACTAVDYHDPDICAKVDARYPPENSPLIKALVDLAMSAARNDPDGSKHAASKALTAAADEAVKRHWPTGRYLRDFDQRVSGGRHGALFGLHVATVEVKQRLSLSGDPSKSLLWLAPIEPGHRRTVVDLIGTRRKPLSAVASDLAILTQDQLDLTIRLRGRRTTLTKAEVQRLEDWAVEHLSYTTASLRDGAVPFDSWVEEVTRRLQPPMTRNEWWSSAFREHVAANALGRFGESVPR